MDEALGRALLTLARGSITAEFGGTCTAVEHAALDRPGATFVTLERDGCLRGCVGSLEPVRPLREDVWHNARRAAFADPRFAPVQERELDLLEVQVSLIGPSEPIACTDEATLLTSLRPGVDGLILRFGRARSTFLPQVWESLPDAESFLRELKRKAGLPEDFWHRDLEVSRYTVLKWTERDVATSEAGLPS